MGGERAEKAATKPMKTLRRPLPRDGVRGSAAGRKRPPCLEAGFRSSF
jgi:hypothetical protein